MTDVHRLTHGTYAVLLVAILMITGCGTIDNITSGRPHVYGGVREDLYYWYNGDTPKELLVIDIPFSAILDTAYLPITGLAELSRWITGWPPTSYKLP